MVLVLIDETDVEIARVDDVHALPLEGDLIEVDDRRYWATSRVRWLVGRESCVGRTLAVHVTVTPDEPEMTAPRVATA